MSSFSAHASSLNPDSVGQGHEKTFSRSTAAKPSSAKAKVEKKSEEIYIPLYELNWPNALRWRGSVLPRILPKLVFFLLYSALITSINQLLHNRVSLATTNTLVTVIGLVTSLILAFRTNTAYDRFWEGRRVWSSMVVAIRNSVRFIWVAAKGRTLKDLTEKRSAMQLLVAYAVASKHYLREEYGVHYDDLIPLISHIPKYGLPSGMQPYQDLEETQISKKTKVSRISNATTHNLPLEIVLYLSAYVQHLSQVKAIDVPIMNGMIAQLNTMMDCLTGFERILRTPIPLAYSIHLSQTVWLYCLALPFQLVGTAGWVTIPFTVVAAFTLFGIESIGGEIENPFGYDQNDLPLDDFCNVIRKEIDMIASQDPPDCDEFFFTSAESATVSREGTAIQPRSTTGTGNIERVHTINETWQMPAELRIDMATG